MAEKPIEGKDIISPDALDTHISKLKETIALWDKFDIEAKKTAKTVKSALSTLSPNKAGSIKEAIAQEKLLSATILEQEKIKRSRIQTEKSLLTLKQKKIAQDKRDQKATQESNALYSAESKRLNDLRRRYKELALSQGINSRAARSLRKEIIPLDRSLKKLDASVGQNFRSVGNYSKALNGLKSGIARLGIGFAVFQGLKDSLSTITNFQQESANLASVLGKTRKEIVALTDDAKRLGSSTAFTASQVIKLQTAFSKLGFNEDEILNATEATLQLAAATGTDLEESATVVGQTLNGFGLEASETQRIVDVMAKSFTSSALDMEKFSSAISNVAPIAKQMNFTVERTTAIIGKLVDTGVDASKAGTDLRQIFIKLSKSGLTFEQAMDKIRNSTNKTKTAVELFDVRAASSAVTLSENTEELNKLDEALQNAGGSAQEMAETQLDTLTGSTTKLASAWEGFILSLESGDGVIGGTIKSIVDLSTEFLSLLTTVNDGGAAFKASTLSNAEAKGVAKVNEKYKEFFELQQKSNTELQSISESDDLEKAFEAVRILELRKLGITSKIEQRVSAQVEDLVLAQKQFEDRESKFTPGQAFTQSDAEIKSKQQAAIKEYEKKIKDSIQRLSKEELAQFDESGKLRARGYGVIIDSILKSELQRRIDIKEVTKETVDSQEKGAVKLTGLQKLQKDLRDLEKQRSDLLVENNGKQTAQFDILSNQAEVLRDQIDLYKEILDGENKITRQAVKTDSVVKNEEGSDTLDKTGLEEINKEIADGISKQERLAQLAEQNARLSQAVTDVAFNQMQKRLEILDIENQAEQRKFENAQTREQELMQLRSEGAVNVEESLAFERKAQAEALAEQERIAKKRQRLELINSGITAFNSAVQSGSTNPAGDTITQLTAVIGFLNAIPAFWEGTETTVGDSLGQKVSNGRDGILARVDKDEIILNKEKSDQLKGMTTDQITRFALMGQNGINTMGVKTIMAPLHDNRINKELLERNNALLEKIANKPSSQFSLETLGKVTKIIEKEHKNNSVTTKVQHKRLGR